MNRDRFSVEFELLYAIRLLERQAKLYQLAKSLNLAIALLLGSAAVGSLYAQHPTGAIVNGLLAAFVGAISVAFQWPEKIAATRADKSRYARLYADRSKLSDEELALRRDALMEGDAPELSYLRDIAYNDAAAAVGRPDYSIKLGRFQKIFAVLS